MQMRWWKVLGVAAFVGVAATGVLVARADRRHGDYPPEEIRRRLHVRAAAALGDEWAELDPLRRGKDETHAEAAAD